MLQCDKSNYFIMGLHEIFKQDNGDDTTTVSVITDDGHCATNTYDNNSAQSTIDDVINDTIQEALDKD